MTTVREHTGTGGGIFLDHLPGLQAGLWVIVYSEAGRPTSGVPYQLTDKGGLENSALGAPRPAEVVIGNRGWSYQQ